GSVGRRLRQLAWSRLACMRPCAKSVADHIRRRCCLWADRSRGLPDAVGGLSQVEDTLTLRDEAGKATFDSAGGTATWDIRMRRAGSRIVGLASGSAWRGTYAPGP